MATGHQGYAYIEGDAQAASVFNRAMVEVTGMIAADVVRVIDFSAANHVIDVGGGHGVLLAAILRAYPKMRGTLFDLAHAVDGANAQMAEAGVASRCTCVTGSFFDFVPAGADIYFLKSILHNWDDATCARILINCRRAMSAGAKLVLVERIMPAHMSATATNRTVARADLNMLVGLGGRERTTSEFTALLGAAGFTVERVLPAGLEFSVVEAVLK